MRSCQALAIVWPAPAAAPAALAASAPAGRRSRRPSSRTPARSGAVRSGGPLSGAAPSADGRSPPDGRPPARAGEPLGRTALIPSVCTQRPLRASGRAAGTARVARSVDASAASAGGPPAGGGRCRKPGASGLPRRRGGAGGGRGGHAVDDRLGLVVRVEVLLLEHLGAAHGSWKTRVTVMSKPCLAGLRLAGAVVRLVLDGRAGRRCGGPRSPTRCRSAWCPRT